MPPVWVSTRAARRAELYQLLKDLGAQVETGQSASSNALTLVAPLGFDVIGDVDALERRKPAAQDVLLGEELDFARAIAQPDEARLAETAPQHDAAKHQKRLLLAEPLDLFRVGAQLFGVDESWGKTGAQLVDGAALLEPDVVRERVLSSLPQARCLFATLLDERFFRAFRRHVPHGV